jgi:hypothetical protein
MPTILTTIIGGPFPPLDSSLWAALWFLVAASLLDFFDISLPRGDSAGGAGALCAAALVVVGPPRALLIAVAAAVAAHAVRRGADASSRLVAVIASRGAAFLMADLASVVLARYASNTVSFALVPAVFLVTELVATQTASALRTGRGLIRLIRGNANSQAPLLAAQWSAAVLLLVTYSGMRVWSLVPVVVLLLLIRQSYALFLSIRETYKTTVGVLVEAAESQDARRAGHSDRTAVLARSIAMNCGLAAAEVERIGYAALLHDLGKLAELTTTEESMESRQSTSADVVHGVKFFERIEPVLRVCDGGGEGAEADESDLLAGLIVALSSDIDAEYHPEVAAAHDESAVARVSHRVTPAVKARAVGAALRLGYRIPAVS